MLRYASHVTSGQFSALGVLLYCVKPQLMGFVSFWLCISFFLPLSFVAFLGFLLELVLFLRVFKSKASWLILIRIYIVNAPMAFTGAWAIIKNFLEERTKKRITILGSNYQKVLFENVGTRQMNSCLKVGMGRLGKRIYQSFWEGRAKTNCRITLGLGPINQSSSSKLP